MEHSREQRAGLVVVGDATYAWCIRNAERQFHKGRLEAAGLWCRIAAGMTEYSATSWFADERLESLLRRIGGTLPPLPQGEPDAPRRDGMRWLHVLTQSYATGGHTALCRRWIEQDTSGDRHDLVHTDQVEAEANGKLIAAARSRRGEVHFLSPDDGLLPRAARLRALSHGVDAIVLHTHMWDPIPTMAFGQPGGAPVLLVNHADHLFWVGASIADMILNIRPSGEALCAAHRGREKLFRLPIPIPAPALPQGNSIGDALRAEQGIPLDAPLFLTIGSAYKYHPVGDFSFGHMADKLMERLPEAFLIAVGPKAEAPLWRDLAEKTGNRVRAVGRQNDLAPYLAAADVYLEGFPFGSLTALLEAALAGLMPVLAPGLCPLPFRSDDFAIEDLPVPRDMDHYVDIAAALAGDTAGRQAAGTAISQRVRANHCVPGWQEHLDKLRSLVKAGLLHEAGELPTVAPLPLHVLDYWAHFSSSRGSDNPFGGAFREALKAGLRPRVDKALFSALRTAKSLGLRTPKPNFATVGSLFLSLLPTDTATRLYLRP